MQRIVFVTCNDYAPWGGSEVLWSQVARLFREQKADVGVSVKNWSPSPKHIAGLANMGCTVHQRNDDSFGQWLDTQNPELVVFSMGNSFDGFHLISECRRKGFKYTLLVQLVAEHNWLTDEDTERWVELYLAAEKCFFVSKKNQELVEKMMGAEIKRASIVQNSFNVSYHEPFKWVGESGFYNLACVASLHAFHKGQDILLKVMQSRKWRTRPIAIDLYGVGPHLRTLSRLKDMWALDQVQFRGFVEDISKVWDDHHALIMPSRMEGMPLAVIEAMLIGRVVITTDVGGNAEFIEDNISGFIAKAPTEELLDEAMERAWQRRTEWESIGSFAYMRARSIVPESPAAVFKSHLCDLYRAC